MRGKVFVAALEAVDGIVVANVLLYHSVSRCVGRFNYLVPKSVTLTNLTMLYGVGVESTDILVYFFVYQRKKTLFVMQQNQ